MTFHERKQMIVTSKGVESKAIIHRINAIQNQSATMSEPFKSPVSKIPWEPFKEDYEITPYQGTYMLTRIGSMGAQKYAIFDTKELAQKYLDSCPSKLDTKTESPFSEIERKIAISDKIERVNGKDYTISATLKNYMSLLQDKKPSKIKTLTEELDHYVKMAVGWGIDESKEVQDSIQLIYNYAMDKRKLMTPKVNTTPIKEFIEFLSQFQSDPYTTVREGFVSLLNLLEQPWLFGLYEETQFSTPKQEIKWEIKLSKQRFKKDAFGLSEKIEKRLDDIKEFYK